MNKIKDLNAELSVLRAKCRHTRRDSRDKGSTGGWDADEYWTEHTCRTCGKFWREYG